VITPTADGGYLCLGSGVLTEGGLVGEPYVFADRFDASGALVPGYGQDGSLWVVDALQNKVSRAVSFTPGQICAPLVPAGAPMRVYCADANGVVSDVTLQNVPSPLVSGKQATLAEVGNRVSVHTPAGPEGLGLFSTATGALQDFMTDKLVPVAWRARSGGRTVLVGNAGISARVFWLLASASIDPSVSDDGLVTLSITGVTAASVADVDAQDRVYVCGTAGSGGSNKAFCARLTAAGALDPLFDDDGVLLLDALPGLGQATAVTALLLDEANAFLYVAGAKGTQAFVVRVTI
jgi:hypothetical protein